MLVDGVCDELTAHTHGTRATSATGAICVCIGAVAHGLAACDARVVFEKSPLRRSGVLSVA
eukprot:3411854-Pleurochrysis_carterae.AAC.2